MSAERRLKKVRAFVKDLLESERDAQHTRRFARDLTRRARRSIAGRASHPETTTLVLHCPQDTWRFFALRTRRDIVTSEAIVVYGMRGAAEHGLRIFGRVRR
jgi:hypothetical protein